MRFVPVSCLRDGMIVAKTLFGKNGECLLTRGAVLEAAYIPRIRNLGFNGIYIDDDISRDIEIVDVINEDLRMGTVKSIKLLYSNMEKGSKSMSRNVQGLTQLVHEMIDAITSNRNLLINMFDLKVFDDYTYYHCVNVGVISLIMGTYLGMGRKELYNLALAAILHDIGKVFIPINILNKPGILTPVEMKTMQSHSQKGYEFIKNNADVPASVYVGVLQHHEKYDGSGYPLGFHKDEIGLFGRIISIADVYDALTSNRPYRKALVPSEAVEYIMGSGGSLFDPDMAKTFVSLVAPYPEGTLVRLSDHRTAIVIKNYNDCSLRPRIKVLSERGQHVTPYIIDLRNDAHAMGITITGFADTY